MRASAAIALIAYSGFLVGVACVGISVDGCATAPDDSDAGYVSTTPTGTTRTPTPEAASPSQGDDEASSPPPDEDAPTTTTGDDGGEDAAGDDASDEAATPPCASNQTCVDQAPMGWTGYVQLRIATADAGVGACGSPYGAVQQSGVADPSGPPAQCSPCTCGSPTSAVTCSSGITTGFLCTSNDVATTLPAGACTQVIIPNSGTQAPTATGSATCATDGGHVVGTPDAAASTPAIVCALGAGDAGATAVDAGAAAPGPICSSTQACAAAIGSQSGPSGVCIYQMGITTCPMGVIFTEQHLVGASLDDTRGCGCSCGPAQCPADWKIEGFTNNGCTGTPAVTLAAGTACGTSVNNATSFKYIQSASASPGSCEVDDAGPTGGVSVDSTTAMTLCCIP